MERIHLAATRRGAAMFVAACALALAASCGNAGGTKGSSAGPIDAAPSSASAVNTAVATATAAPTAAEEAGAPEVASAEPTSSPKAPGKCPEATNPDRVVAYDWSKELGVEAPLAARLRGVGGTAVETRLLASMLEVELRTACAAMAAELGNKGSFANAQVACQAAVDAMKATRKKLGPAAKIAVHAHPAVCAEPIDDVKECAKRCTGADQAPDATCAGATAGKCPGTCDGACEVRAPGVCEGTCLGRCESGFVGTCEGTCKGKCDGKPLSPGGECKGKCDGACDAVAKGECKGKCAGGCQLHASACAGLCAGKCSVPVQEARCLGSIKLAATSAECASYCELRAVHRMTCGAAQVDVRIVGTKDPAATAYAGAIERHLPAVLKIEQQLKGRIEPLNKAKLAVSDGLKAISTEGSAAMPSLSSCIFSYDKATAEGVASLLENYRSVNEVAVVARAK